MKKIIFILIIVFTISNSYAQSKKEIIQELTIENNNLKKEMASLNDKITSLTAEITSLKKELTADKIQTPQEYGKTIFDLFVSQRLAKYPELQFQLKDTLFLIGKDVKTIKEVINKIQKNSLEFYLEGINNGIDWSKVEYDNFDFEISEPTGDISINHLRGKFYFNFSGKKYSFENEVSVLENGKWRGFILKKLVNETETMENEKKEKQERLNEPYVPYPIGVKFGSLRFTYYSNETTPKLIYDLKLPIENNTKYPISWMKFQFKIYENGDLILSKNIIVSDYDGFDSKLEPGEKEIVLLKDIEEVFISSGVKKGNWYSDIKLLEVEPKPSEE
jgi:hypothetical protein